MKKNVRFIKNQFNVSNGLLNFVKNDMTKYIAKNVDMITKNGPGSLLRLIFLLLISKNSLFSFIRIILQYFTIKGNTNNKNIGSATSITVATLWLDNITVKDVKRDRVRANTIFQKLIFVLRFAGILAMSFCIKLFGFVRLSIIHSLSILLTLSNIAYYLRKIMISQVIYSSKRITKQIVFIGYYEFLHKKLWTLYLLIASQNIRNEFIICA